ncbi:MAG: cupin domain-containing protein [Rhizomicrobium sp.]
MEFDQVIAPLQRNAFLTDHWEKSWLHVQGAADRFGNLLSWDDLGAILENTRIAPPHIRLSKDGHSVAPELYIHTPPGAGNPPQVDPGRLVAQLADGATLILYGVEDLAPKVRALSESFRDTLSARSHVNLYASWRRENGFDLHWDAHEVMVLQLHGRKQWQIFAPTQDWPLDAGVPPRPTGAPVWDGLLNAGDVLYLPRGWWHVAHAVNEPSLHLTFGIAPMHGLNLLNWMATRLRGNSDLRRNLPLLRDAAARKAYMAQLRAIVAETLDDAAIETFMRDADAHVHGRPSIQWPRAPYNQAALLQGECLLRLASAPRLSLMDQGDKVAFRAYDKTYSVPANLRPALALLSDRHGVPLARLCAALDGAAAAASLKQGLAMLARAGVVMVETE